MIGKKKKERVYIHEPEAENNLYLYLSSRQECPGFECYDLVTWNPHSGDYEGFLPIAGAVAESVFSDLTAVIDMGYALYTVPRRVCNCFQGDISWLEGDADKALDYLCLHPELDCSFWRETTKTEDKLYPVSKILHIAKSNISEDFFTPFINTLTNNGACRNVQLMIDGFPMNETNIRNGKSRDIEPAVSIEYDGTHAMLRIYRNKEAYSLDDLIRALSIATHKHDKKLEVQL